MKKRKNKKKISRREFLSKAGAITIATGAFSVASGFPAIFKGGVARAGNKKFEGRTIRLLTWSDECGHAAVRHIAKPFEAKTGAKVIPDLAGSTSEMVAKIKASAAKPQYDVITLSGFGGLALADAGLLQPPDLKKIPNAADVPSEFRTGGGGHCIGYMLWCDGLIYNTKTFPATPPRSYEILWEDKYAGRIAVAPPAWLTSFDLIVIAARIGGGDQYNPEPGWKLLEKLSPNVLTLSESMPQVAELFRSNALDLSGVDSALMYPEFLRDPTYNMGATLKLKEGFFLDLQFIIIPKGHPGDDEATHAFLNYALEPTVQAKLTENVGLGPINEKTVLSKKAAKSPYIPTPRMIKENSIRLDMDHLASVREDWTRRYTEIFSR